MEQQSPDEAHREEATSRRLRVDPGYKIHVAVLMGLFVVLMVISESIGLSLTETFMLVLIVGLPLLLVYLLLSGTFAITKNNSKK